LRIELVGELDVATAPELQQRVDEIAAPPATHGSIAPSSPSPIHPASTR
jgi:anti-anti-sigma regulatory factor